MYRCNPGDEFGGLNTPPQQLIKFLGMSENLVRYEYQGRTHHMRLSEWHAYCNSGTVLIINHTQRNENQTDANT